MALGQTAGCPRVNRAKKFMCSPRNTGSISFSLWLTGGFSQGCPDFQKVFVFKVYVPFSCPKACFDSLCGRAPENKFEKQTEYPPARNEYMQEKILGECVCEFLCKCMRGLHPHSREYRKIISRSSFPHACQILRGIHVSANTCRACREYRKIPGEYFFNWFHARGYLCKFCDVCSLFLDYVPEIEGASTKPIRNSKTGVAKSLRQQKLYSREK